jgi:hypothetical protein
VTHYYILNTQEKAFEALFLFTRPLMPAAAARMPRSLAPLLRIHQKCVLSKSLTPRVASIYRRCLIEIMEEIRLMLSLQ